MTAHISPSALRDPPEVLESDAPVKASALAALLGPRFAFASAVPRVINEQLFPDERKFIARAVEKRQAEFGTARVCARRALAKLGVAPCSLVPHADRSPRWPEGVVGSITHAEGCCIAAATVAPDVAGFGLDVEEDEPLSRELEPLICTTAERLWLATQESRSRGWLGKLFFSAKEAFYKCQYRHTRTLIDFQDVELKIDLHRNNFRAVAVTQNGPVWDRVCRASGKFLRAQGFIVTAAFLTE